MSRCPTSPPGQGQDEGTEDPPDRPAGGEEKGMSGKKDTTRGNGSGGRRREEERELWDRINQRLIDSVPKGTMASDAPWQMSVAMSSDPELKALLAELRGYARSGTGYIHDRLQERKRDDPEIGDLAGLPKSLEEGPSAEDREVFLLEAERLLGVEPRELRRLATEVLKEGAEVLRRHYGWSDEELAKQLDLPPDFTSSGYVEVKPIHLGRRITELREIAGLSPVELADAAGVSIELVRVLEEGRQDANPYLEELKRLASALDTNLTFLEYWAERLEVES